MLRPQIKVISMCRPLLSFGMKEPSTSKQLRMSSSNLPPITTNKRINETVDGNQITIKGQTGDSCSNLLKIENKHGSCPLCRLNLKLRFDDILILEQFMRPDGSVLPRQVSGLCPKQQKIMERLVMQAHWSGLFPEHRPGTYKADEGTYKEFKRQWNEHYDMYTLDHKIKKGIWYYIKRYY